MRAGGDRANLIFQITRNRVGADKSAGRWVGVGSGDGGERSRKMKKEKWKDPASAWNW